MCPDLRMAITMTAACVVGFISLLFYLFWRAVLMQPLPRLPPGPRPLPILGNSLMVKKYATTAELADELKRKYGPIFTVWLFSTPMVIISEPKLIREAMVEQGSVFMGRPQFQSAKVFHYGFRGLIFGQGERHRFLRKMMVSEILSNRRVSGFRSIRERELDILVESLRKKLGNDDNKGGTVTNFRDMIRLTICNLMTGVLFGRRLTLAEFVDLNELMIQRIRLAVAGTPKDLIPWLAWLPDGKSVKAKWELRKEGSRVLGPLIEERLRVLESGKADGRVTYVDTLLGIRHGKIESPIDILHTDIELICLEVLNGGTDTTALNLEYCVANLINYPETQEKLAQEISTVVGARVVNEDDMPHLPYLQATIKEALRRHPPARLAPARRALSATKVAGYDIPKDTIVLQHLEAVSLSSEIWEDPLEFRPERHLNKTPDVTGASEIEMIPFGMGRRICPGINLALLHGELILARLVQAFVWKSATPGQPKVDITAGEGFTNPMRYPLIAALEERFKV